VQWFLDPERIDYVAAVERFANQLLIAYAPG
jgi:hypothetical protein